MQPAVFFGGGAVLAGGERASLAAMPAPRARGGGGGGVPAGGDRARSFDLLVVSLAGILVD